MLVLSKTEKTSAVSTNNTVKQFSGRYYFNNDKMPKNIIGKLKSVYERCSTLDKLNSQHNIEHIFRFVMGYYLCKVNFVQKFLNADYYNISINAYILDKLNGRIYLEINFKRSFGSVKTNKCRLVKILNDDILIGCNSNDPYETVAYSNIAIYNTAFGFQINGYIDMRDLSFVQRIETGEYYRYTIDCKEPIKIDNSATCKLKK